MRRASVLTLVGCLFAPFSVALAKTAAAPKWAVFESMPEGVIYVDPGSITKQGNFADMWVLIDYKQPQDDRTGKQIKSDKLHYRYDCAGRQFSIVTSSAYAGAMGTGAVIDVNADPQLNPVPPGTTADQMLKRACGIAG
jgi:hypothetical protein